MPQPVPTLLPVVHFAPFDLDLRTGELWKDGTRIRLQEHPFAILRRLLESPGDVVTRDELRAGLWPNGTIVDFEHELDTAMNRLREALGDDAERPRFVETVQRHGYRFIAPVQTVSAGSEPGELSCGWSLPQIPAPAAENRRRSGSSGSSRRSAAGRRARSTSPKTAD